jgi:PAS domain S-box-containing protein
MVMGKTKILIVEDEVIVAEAIKSSLESMDYEVVAMVKTGKAAVESAEKDCPDIILMDIRLKGQMDGIEAADLIRSRSIIPIIFLTAYADEDKIDRAKLTLPFGYVLKPFQDRDLKVAIEMALYAAKVDAERKRAEEALKKRTYDLGERVKELNCLYGISNLVEKPDISLPEILQGSVDLVPPSWQYPEITCGRITFEGQAFLTEHFQETTWKQVSDIIVRGNKIGNIEVYYLEEKPTIDDGPFLREERDLIDAIAGRLGRIIDRKKAEEEIHRSKILLESSIESPKDMIILSLDREYRYLYFNKTHAESMSHVYGTRPQIGDCIFDHMKSKDDIEQAKKNYDRALDGEGHVVIEEYGEDQLRYYYEIRYNPIYDEKNEIIGVSAFAQNIIERKQAEEALQQSEERYRSVVEHSLQGICIHQDDILQFANLAFAKMFGYTSPDELVGKNVWETLVDHEKWPELKARNAKILSGETIPVHTGWEGIRKDGTRIWIQSTGSPFSWRDRPANLGVYLDVTELKRAEEALRESEECFRKSFDTELVAMSISRL